MEKTTEVCCSRCKRWVGKFYDYGIMKVCESCDDPENRSLLREDAPECFYEEAL